MFLETEVAAAVFPHFRLLLWVANVSSKERIDKCNKQLRLPSK